jgi:hypothetical protein
MYIPLTTININWEILFANTPYFLFWGVVIVIIYMGIYAITAMLTDAFSGFSFYDDVSKTEHFLKTNCIIVPIALIIWGLVSWIEWSNNVLDKPENKNKPIIEHIELK